MLRPSRFLLAGILLLTVFCPREASAERRFAHPGITYTQADLDRMKAMVREHREPFYSTYLALVQGTVPGSGGYGDILQIKEGEFNATIGTDGRRAHDLALLYRITGNTAYADDAVRRINRYNHLTNASSRGTAPLDNGKIYLLLDAAELLRDYPGWLPADQAAFKKMLTYPGYSSAATPDGHWSLNDSLNDVSFYWNIFNFDPGRYGNQGLFAARGLLAMGVYLDNDTLYDRAYRYLTGQPHRPDDLPYRSGPPKRTGISAEDSNQISYNVTWLGDSADYHSDETLPFYLYRNGQCQESSRDQGHVLAGVGNYTAIAEIAWNQGDTLYNLLDRRILVGLEYNLRYNLSLQQSYPDQPTPWEPSGASKSEADVSYGNGIYYQAVSRSGRWEAKRISNVGRGDGAGNSWKTGAMAHYVTRMGADSASTLWLRRSYDAMIAASGIEAWGSSGHQYEWTGWGTLTKSRTPWMAGEACSFRSGTKVSGLPKAPCSIAAADYDDFPADPEGHTVHRLGTPSASAYRPGPTVGLRTDSASTVVDLQPGEWLSYSLDFPSGNLSTSGNTKRLFNVYVTYKASRTGAQLFAAVDGGTRKGKDLLATTGWNERLLGTFQVACGAGTLKLFAKGSDAGLSVKSLRIEPVTSDTLVPVDLLTAAKSIRVFDAAGNDISSGYAPAISRIVDGDKSVSIDLPAQKYLVFDFGEKGQDLNRVTFFNDGKTQDSREQAMVQGPVTDSTIDTSRWPSGGAVNFLRTNGSQQALAVPVIRSSWAVAGTIGSYEVGPVGRYRYLALYDWSARCNVSELSILTPATIQLHASDTEASAAWQEATALQAHRPSPLHLNGRALTAPGAVKIQAWSPQGRLLEEATGERMDLPKGLCLVRIRYGQEHGNATVSSLRWVR